ncbi:MAG: CusA/CzcA family heavy metal efflux RND transporter [Phycisphaerae bacterium]|nr:CusA/CzcA family heavy metal efflux RND transporter [Phycisphaerae bacterium]MBM92965.1 CusA/CzcA family heavy metal efflux RND transporter [Phycisphaerae bacterium]
MLGRVIDFSIRQRTLVLLATLALVGVGVYSFTRLPIDAVPDITNVQVQINTNVPALSPVEIEQQVTFPIEWSMGGLPNIDYVRSISRYGLSQVTVVFEEGTDIFWARQLVGERLTEARGSLPPGLAEPQMGPISTGLGEIYMWSVEATGLKPDGSEYSPQDLRTVQDWVIRPQLRTVPGVTEVNSIGAYEEQFHVTPDPAKLMAFGLSFRDIMQAIAENNANAGGGYIEHAGEAYLVRATGLIRDVEDIRNIIIKSDDGVPVHIRDVADVGVGDELRTGAATHDGQEVVIGTAMMLLGANSRTVSEDVHSRMEQIQKTLPENVTVKTLYNRTYLVDATLHTIEKNLFEGAVLVIVILLLLLGNLRAAVIVACAIPLSMLFAITGMVENKVSANLLSLGAIDFGIIVDGAVVFVENIVRRASEEQEHKKRRLTNDERLSIIGEAGKQVAKPTLFGILIIMIVYLPVLTLTGIEGKMFRPMAGVVLLALAGALILTFTFIPAACALLLRGKFSEKESFLIRWTKTVYRPSLNAALRLRWLTVGFAVLLLLVSGLVASRLGSEFVPKLGEGALAVQPARIPSIGITTSVEMQKDFERSLRDEFPDEIASIFARTGTAEVATDPMGPNVSDTYLMLNPREEWTRASTQEELAEEIEEFLGSIPGQNYEISQPIELRFNELISGVRSDLAVKIFGDDLDLLLQSGNEIAAVMQTIPGASDVKVEQVSGLSVLTIDIDREKISRYGLNVSDIQEVVSIAFGGEEAGTLYDGDRRFPIVVRLPENLRGEVDFVRNLPIPLPEGEGVQLASADESMPGMGAEIRYIPLEAVAQVDVAEGPNQISRENAKRRLVVQANIRGRDMGSFVAEAQERLDAEVALPDGYYITWGGQFENLARARQRLLIVVPLALSLIFIMLFTAFGNARHAILVYTGVPLALTGGIIALWLRGMPFSISAGVGFIALSGVAVLNGVVMITFINQLRDEGKTMRDAVIEGSLSRLRPVLMTALVASLGFVPMALNTGMGAEVQRPLATVVIGGLISSTVLTLFVLPTLYLWFGGRKQEIVI